MERHLMELKKQKDTGNMSMRRASRAFSSFTIATAAGVHKALGPFHGTMSGCVRAFRKMQTVSNTSMNHRGNM
jgi:hypothetical protein